MNPQTKKKHSIPKPISTPQEKLKKVCIAQEELEKVKKRHDEKLLFSFKFFDREHKAFNLGSVCNGWYITLIDTLKEISNFTWRELITEQYNHYEPHQHNWESLDYRFGIDNETLDQVECTQFRLSSSKGRVHGFLIGNRFYIVWLDAHHNLYPNENFGGRKFYTTPMTCYQKLESRNLELERELEMLKKENSDLTDILEEAYK